jgi:formate dehydrogenase subunit gamma
MRSGEAAPQGAAIPVGAGDPAVVAARTRENVAIGDEIVRHRMASRVMHWTVAISFLVLLFTGLPIWSPLFGWMAALFGGLHVCRWLHPWAGVVFMAGSVWMLAHWAGEMMLRGEEKKWLSPTALINYLRYPKEDPTVGKYNGGQKLFFWMSVAMAVVIFLTGVVLWFPTNFGQALREVSLVLHDLTFIAFTVAIIGHIYLGTFAFPGTFEAMVRGTVSRSWARLHHPRWYREVTGDDSRR